MATVRKFSAAILSRLEAKHGETAFVPSFVNGHWRQGKFSHRQQADMRKACLINNVDPTSIGMPPPKPKGVLHRKPPKGHKQQRLYKEKQAAIQKNLDDMPNKIQRWKEELEKEKLKSKPSLPF
ncbi:hypothetical protein GGI25_005581 [Coemansia spiralis]|uniref:Large ribosomal subunit protein mL59 domain-containing protein n=2 Tax=Coemansia TaxID=4863 RepID=A0A9W8FYE9_9FUNG|nr:hypothetical protein BX070DRAFT_231434 [Coemansia spiralis]KAJ1987801.1 hypothetical protein EDC05_005634 [Coemansia umbellata]KAJ2619462.1 hypothetical protein GGI26_005827 [Coemansia sp. RSA 1358]KAJ2671216.1 hypothetical protein GGI25_005581 [Coemansia spiralis]